MKKRRLITLLLLALCAASCEKNIRYSPFDGFWQVTSVEDKTTGTVSNPEGRLYISFECELAKLSYLPEDRNTGFLGYEYVGSYIHRNDSLLFSPFYKYREETTEAPAHHLSAFGIHKQPASFALTMTKKRMTLENTSSRLTLRKY